MAHSLVELLGEENLPRNAYYGDGSPIQEESLKVVRELYQKTKIRFKWHKYDIMILDNVRFTHGRESFIGSRNILVGMGCLNQNILLDGGCNNF